MPDSLGHPAEEGTYAPEGNPYLFPQVGFTGMPSSDLPEFIWYAGYGSNLDLGRFKCYLDGTSPREGAPAPDRFPGNRSIAGEASGEYNFKLFFAYGSSRTWGPGGVAFLETQPRATLTTLVRMFKLTIPQLAWVVKGENDLTDPPPIESCDLKGTTTRICCSGRYQLLLRCGDFESLPVMALTGEPDRDVRDILPPSPPYRAMMRSGLHQTFPGMSYNEIDRYLDMRVPQPRPKGTA